MRPIMFIIWTEVLGKFTAILGEVLSQHEEIMGSFCFFILFSTFKFSPQ